MRTSDRLTRSGIYHHITNTVIRLSLGHRKHIAYMIQHAHHPGRRVADFYDIHTHGQTLELYRIGKHLVVFMDSQLLGLAHQRLA